MGVGFLILMVLAGTVFPSSLWAQTNRTFSEDFSNSSDSPWFVESTERGSAKVEDGKYYLESKTSDYYAPVPGVVAGEKKPFEITFSVKWLSGNSSEWGYGISWGKGVDKEVTSLVFSGNLNYIVYQVDKKNEVLKDPVYCPYLLPSKANIVTVKYDGKRLTALVNDKVQYEGKIKQWGGSFFFVLFDKQSIEIDDLKIVYTE